jgi:hypothetical protein
MTISSDKTLLRGRAPAAKTGFSATTTGSSSWSWRRPVGHTPAAPSVSLVSGSVLKDRFILETPIGRGGMGTVFKARDLRKEEALDRNPHVAIKVLNEDFKEHHGALQALQRESRKAQKLAHPNIVTVFDFDRDDGNVYMVMELLQGIPLDRLIKLNQDNGIGVKDALRVMRGICKGMAYAHEQGILHADFKPANAFVTTEGVAKVCDFGIARAVEVTDLSDSQGLTRFDPGMFGALTPAYAGCEVMEGQEPELRDDIYAIACVTYELITGSHPYNRLSAKQAEKAHMTPDQPPGMSARRWRVLRRALAFRRDGRPNSAMELIDGISPFGGSPTLYAMVAVTAFAALTVASVPIGMQVNKVRERGTIAALASGDARQVEPILEVLRTLGPTQRGSLLLHDDARAGLLKYYTARVDELVDEDKGHYEYEEAQSLLAELGRFFPDSQAVRDMRDRLNLQKSATVQRLSAALEADLRRGWVIPAQNPENIAVVLAHLLEVDPNSPLLDDPRLPGAFAASARHALEMGQPQLADALAVAGVQFAPHAVELTAVSGKVQRALSASVSPTRKAATNSRDMADSSPLARLEAGLAHPTLSLQQARAIAQLIDDIGRRGDIDAPSLRSRLEAQLLHSVAALKSKRGLEAAADLAKGACALLPGSAQLARVFSDLRADLEQRAATQRDAQIASTRGEVEALLEHPTLDDSWDNSLRQKLQGLETHSPADEAYVTDLKHRVAGLYVAKAGELRGAGKLPESGKMLTRAGEYEPSSQEGSVEAALLADASTRQKLGAHKAERTAYVSSLKHKLTAQADANDVGSARITLRVLRENLPDTDRFLTRDGPADISHAYERLAQQAVNKGELKSAAELMRRARDASPGMAPLATAQDRYARYEALDDRLTRDNTLDVSAVRGEISELYAQDPGTAKVVVPILARDLASRLHSTGDPELAGRLSREGNEIFGGGPPFDRD